MWSSSLVKKCFWQRRLYLLFVAVSIMIATVQGYGQVITIAQWNFGGIVQADNYGASPYAPATIATNVSIVGVTRGTGFTRSGTAAASGWGGNGLTESSMNAAITAGDTVTFTIKPDAGYAIDFNQIAAYNIRRSGTGPTTMQWQYKVGNSGTFGNIGSSIAIGSTTTDRGNDQAAILLSNIPRLQTIIRDSSVTFRIVLWAGSGAGGNWYFNSRTNVPEANRYLTITGTRYQAVIDITSPTSASFCVNKMHSFSTVFTKTLPGTRTYTVQLSNSAGSFASPTPIGSGTASPIACTIPANTVAAGTGYRMRIVSGPVISDTIPVVANAVPNGTLTAVSSTVCIGATEALLRFTPSAGTAPYSIEYRVNAGSPPYNTRSSLPAGVTNFPVSVPLQPDNTYQLMKITDNIGCIRE